MAATESRSFLLITDDLRAESISLAGIDARALHHGLQGDRVAQVPLSDALALVRPQPRTRALPRTGLLTLADGQQFPGQPLPDRASAGEVAWHHNWLGRIAVPLEAVASMHLTPGAPLPPRPDERAMAADRLLLSNDDVLEGLLIEFGDPVLFELTGGRAEPGRAVEVPLARIASMQLIAAGSATPDRAARDGPRRVATADGTVFDAADITLDEEGIVRLASPWEEPEVSVRLAEVRSVIFAPWRLLPLAGLAPRAVEAPPTRYTAPGPAVPMAGDRTIANAGLKAIEFRGPIRVHYELPEGVRRFAAEALLPPEARQWGDFELIVLDGARPGAGLGPGPGAEGASGGREIFRATLNADHPTAQINVPLLTPHLTIEMAEGAHGPIQDRLRLERPRLLIER